MDASIVIATRNRANLLARTLRSLEQLAGSSGFEVIVADHGSEDDTGRLVNATTALPLRRVEVPFRGESIADPKNAGGFAAKGDILVFLDSGMICPPDFLAEHVAAHRREPDRLVAGAVVGWDSEDDGDPFWRALDEHGLAAAIPGHLADPRAPRWSSCRAAAWMLVWGANMSLARTAFVEHGGFDEQLSGWGWDDLELAYRLNDAGIPPAYAPQAWAIHYPHPRRALAERMRTAQENWLRAYRRHRSPELETWQSCGYWSHASCLRWLRELTASLTPLLPAPPTLSASSRVLYGFAAPAQPVPTDTYIVWPGRGRGSGGAVRSYGLRTPLPAGYAGMALASPALLAFDRSPEPGWPSLAEGILRELARVAPAVRLVASRRLAPGQRERLRELAAGAELADFDVIERV